MASNKSNVRGYYADLVYIAARAAVSCKVCVTTATKAHCMRRYNRVGTLAYVVDGLRNLKPQDDQYDKQ